MIKRCWLVFNNITDAIYDEPQQWFKRGHIILYNTIIIPLPSSADKTHQITFAKKRYIYGPNTNFYDWSFVCSINGDPFVCMCVCVFYVVLLYWCVFWFSQFFFHSIYLCWSFGCSFFFLVIFLLSTKTHSHSIFAAFSLFRSSPHIRRNYSKKKYILYSWKEETKQQKKEITRIQSQYWFTTIFLNARILLLIILLYIVVVEYNNNDEEFWFSNIDGVFV